MKDFLKEMKKYSMIFVGVTAIVGILLIAFPGQAIIYTSIAIGGCIMACGVIAIIRYLIKKDSAFMLVLGIIALVLGIIVCATFRQIANMMIYVLGLILLFGGILDLAGGFLLAKNHSKASIVTFVLSAVSIIFGILSLVHPFGGQKMLVRIIGVGLLAFAALDVYTYFAVKKFTKKLDDEMSGAPGSVEVEYEEVHNNTQSSNDDYTNVNVDYSKSPKEVDFEDVDEN